MLAEHPSGKSRRIVSDEDAESERKNMSTLHEPHRAVRCERMLAQVPAAFQAEATALFWQCARLEDAAVVAGRQRDRKRKRRAADAAQAKEASRAARQAASASRNELHVLLIRAAGRTPHDFSSRSGQCEGTTACGQRCKVHSTSPYAVAALLRNGGRFCGHHDPSKYTGTRCAGMKKRGKGQCRMWSGFCYADAAPLRRGSPYCHHHRVRCAGQTVAGVRCTITTSSKHEHAAPLRRGEPLCAHHCSQPITATAAAPAPTPMAMPVVAAQTTELPAVITARDSGCCPICNRPEAWCFCLNSDDVDSQVPSDIDELPAGVYVDSDGNVYSDDDCGYY